jgi:NAD(P)-dependent dehydrogenase (short-subunit alcohol dehydrogenase family)
MVQPNELFDLSGKTAFITGAGAGLGRAFAAALADAGAAIIAADIVEDRVEETTDILSKAGKTCEALTLDVAESEAVADVFEGLEKIDILINNAGITTPALRTHEIEIEDWRRLLDIHLNGAYYCTRAAIPKMLAGGGGSIINIASIVGEVGVYPDFPMVTASYAAAKAALSGLTKQLAAEYAADGIRANAIAPGWHGGTRLGERNQASMTNEQISRFEEAISTGVPMGHRGTPDNLDGLVVYLASDASSYLTGQIIVHDGGWTVV